MDPAVLSLASSVGGLAAEQLEHVFVGLGRQRKSCGRSVSYTHLDVYKRQGSLSQIDRSASVATRRRLADCNASNIRLPPALMIICFLVSIALTAFAGSSVVR